jgi:hypothetical protein
VVEVPFATCTRTFDFGTTVDEECVVVVVDSNDGKVEVVGVDVDGLDERSIKKVAPTKRTTMMSTTLSAG